ncbi:MAG: HAMP domain-containing sensor histidine kinase [Candidatus Eisenbacteria bacterium]
MGNPSYKTLYRRAQFLYQLGRELERLSSQHDLSRVVRFCLRGLGEALEADLAIQIDLRASDQTLKSISRLGLSSKGVKLLERSRSAGGPGDPSDPEGGDARLLEQCRAFLQRGIGPEDRELLLVKVQTGERVAAVLGFRRPGRNFGRADATLAQNAAELLSLHLKQREHERAQSLKERIYGKLLGELRAKDVLYHVLHGLERLLQFDHSGAVLLLDPSGRELRLEAEIVTWTKAKSSRIGRAFRIDEEGLGWLRDNAGVMLVRGAGTISPSEGGEPSRGQLPRTMPSSLLAALEHQVSGAPRAGARIIAPLLRGQTVLGVLQVQGRSPAAFNTDDLALLAPFLPLAAAAVYNSELYESQHSRLISAERKVALADLARAISHDLNNAFGVMMPLLQALKRDLAEGTIELADVSRDLEVVSHYAEMSARIFRGLLSVARGRTEEPRWLDLEAVVEAILTMLGPSLVAQHIEVSQEKSERLPTLLARRGEMEQLVLNLIYNARDAMPNGGALTVGTRPESEGIRLEIRDNGPGIPTEIRAKIFEPFFTTKATGSGLGLDICRSIVWDYDGRLDLESEIGSGTSAIVWLPRESRQWKSTPEAPAIEPGKAR